MKTKEKKVQGEEVRSKRKKEKPDVEETQLCAKQNMGEGRVPSSN
jgi:hypothetical protein